MESSDGIDKSWDYPWTTEEMRKKRREWSLAGDVGLLKHLQQFSENLMSRTNKTQAALDTLTTQLKETGILVDNVTNTSLALANTQFIESRVQEDDIEIKENSEKQEIKTQDLVPENLLASISESVKQGLNIMDEKYKVMDVACSDSEEEDEGGAVVFSVIVEPNDPYQDRPLPYVIGSDKWTASNKIGLESSSSESEQADEERDESESEKEDASMQKVFNSRHNPDMNIARLSSSSSDSDNYNDSSNAPYMNNKADIISQNNINSASESVTPNNVSKTSNDTEPNFAEELAKRLGTVRQAQNPIVVDEASESSINRFKGDLFASEKDENIFNDNSDNLFNDKKDLFNDEVSANLWKKKPIKSYKSNNIIPPSIDVPPPINIVSTKPKSAIDDLFADADSDDDSDIFSSRNIVKKRAKEPTIGDNIPPPAKKFLNVMGATGKVATSTPESNVNAESMSSSGLFNDDENDDANLFGIPKKQPHKTAGTPSSTNTIQEWNKKESMLGNISSSDVESKLSSQIMQRRRESSGSSSDSDAPGSYDDVTKSNVSELASAERDSSVADRRLQITPAENSAENMLAENTDNSSGVYMPSTDHIVGSSLWMSLESPEMTSTRLKSEEIYRERVTSDSLFTAQTLSANPASANSNNQQQQPSRQEQQNSLSLLQDDVFENDDLFGPPPLPTKSDAKRAPKSKTSLLFDDSDSGDELFSAASSGSRSQKSTDFLAGVSSSDRTTKILSKSGGLFDDDNIFGSRDAPDIDIFGATSKSRDTSDDLFDNRGREQYSVTSKSNNIDNSQDTRMESKRISLFDDDGDDGDLFTSAKSTKPKSDRKTDVLFEDEDDLFSSNKKSSNKKHSSFKEASVEPKIDVSKNTSSLETGKKNKDNSSDYMDGLFPKAKTRSLLFENDDYDDLFGKKDSGPIHENNRSKPESKEEIKEDTIEKVQEFPEQNKDLESSSLSRDSKAITEIKSVIPKSDTSEEKHKDEVSGPASKAEEDGRSKKSSPPKTLSIRTTSSPPSEEQNGQQVPRKSVSGKIKNLMGKMGDLKILSPMDAPPLWRKSEDKMDDDENIMDKDGDQGIDGCISPPSVSESSIHKEFSYSTTTISTTSNVEVAINFDDLAQVETLSTTASKSRVRIQAKRRPQSRHARKSALRHSGIDFDTVDSADNDNSLDESHTNTFSSTKDLSSAPSISAADRLTANNVQRSTVDPSSTDDKSELGSISKESSMSVNKNTLLSPSTDEEDLFDVPPDLPEDPQREDTLFGRAPILSPIDDGQSDRTPIVIKPIDSAIRKIDAADNKSPKQASELTRSAVDAQDTSDVLKDVEKKDDQERKTTGKSEEPSDPLRDSSHDPLKDPSQLFAFVTKTPSPEKNRGLLFSESDDSLFSSSSANKLSEPRKKVLDLFADDDAGGDLFSAAPLKKTVLKKPLRDTKIGLFGADDDARNKDDNLFSSSFSKTRQEKSSSVQAGRKRSNIFDDDDDEDSSLFVESSGQSQKSDSTSFSESKHELADSQARNSNLKDIFGEVASSSFPAGGKIDDDEDDTDLFVARKVAPKKVKSLFESDDENDDDDGIFGKQSSVSIDSRTTTIANLRPAMKKSITRDLKKTAEKIVEDPLSLLQDE